MKFTDLALSALAIIIIGGVFTWTTHRDGIHNPDFASYGQPVGK
jgi:hypothetical protein